MIKHYLKIAFRNMWKYKSQTLISVLGLAVGFTCFALATLWIVYEMTYDNFHKNAKQMYVVFKPDSYRPSGYNRQTYYSLASYLKETFPEVANAIPLIPPARGSNITAEGVEVLASIITADTSFLRMFDIKLIVGSMDFAIPGAGNKYAITQEKARQLFGDEHPIGKTVTMGESSIEICAIVSGMSKHSNIAFDFIKPFSTTLLEQRMAWRLGMTNTIIELFPGTNVKAFEKKLYEHETGDERGNIKKMKVKPLTKLRYTDPDIERDLKFQHILIFAISGFLVILCSLFNYLTLFMSRFRIRQKELALRMVSGASGRSLLTMLSVEFMLTLTFAVVLGLCLTQLVQKPFLTLSGISMNLPAIYKESLMYIGGIILVSLLAFWLILFIFQHRSLNVSIRRSNKNMFRKASVVVQLFISIGFAFCVIVILKQMYFLHHTNELGFSFKNRGSLVVYQEYMQIPQTANEPGQPITISFSGSSQDISNLMASELPLVNQLKQIAEITEVVDVSGLLRLLPQSGRNSQEISSWDDKSADVENISLERMFVSPEYAAFYDFQLLAGEMLTDADPSSMVLLNESAVKAFGWYDAIDKQFDRFTVKGVIKHVSNMAPTIEAKPCFYVKNFPGMLGGLKIRAGSIYTDRLVLFKYHEGTWKSCKEKIEQLKDEFEIYNLSNDEEAYDTYLKSETTLVKLLSFASAICVLICVFGFVSLVSLTCDERRKSIAIRKINGATAGDILVMFAKEYFLLLAVGAALAFSTGYFIMQRWLEHYVKQTRIPVWIYLSIIFAMALVIVLCVGWQVYKASVKNPAEVVKSE